MCMRTQIENLVKEWEKLLIDYKEELGELLDDPDYDDHEADNLSGHIERLGSDILALEEVLKNEYHRRI